MAKVFQYLHPELIAFLEVASRDEAIERMIDLVHGAGYISDKEAFEHALLERERIVSTAIGMGVAIPHAKLAGYEEFFVAIGILSKGVEWGALDGAHVRVILMIGGPDDKQTEYLQLLSGVTTALKDEERRKALLTEKSVEKIVELFKAY